MRQHWYVLNHGWFMFTVPGEHKLVCTCKSRRSAQLLSLVYSITKFPNWHSASPSCTISKEEVAQFKHVFTAQSR